METEAEFPGGYEALMNFFKENIKYPKEAKGEKVRVMVRFIVEKDGTVTVVKVINEDEVKPYFVKAAIDSFLKMPLWEPGTYDGSIIRTYYQMPINFVPK